MKTLTTTAQALLFACFLMLSTSVFAQSIITIDNNPNSTTTHQTLQDAHDAATAGDIIYVQPSPTNYGSVTITKALTIVGRSHSEVNNVSTIGSVTINASDVTLKGLKMSTVSPYSTISGSPITNIKLYECYASIAIGAGYSVIDPRLIGFEARGCVLTNITQYADAQDVLISNNIITSGLTIYSPVAIVIANNIFRFSSSFSLRNYATGEIAILYNNMFIVNSTADRTVTFATGDWNVSNNLLYNYADTYSLNFTTSGSATYSDSNTLLGVDPLFVNIDATDSRSFAGTSSYDASDRVLDDMTLQAGSPALTGGGGGTEMGLYNNGFIYKNSGNPKGIPTIDITTYDGAVPKNGTINVTITAKAH
ncbi:right-handed parallel beta-helix repeat-containing protein [Winogradskyella helgolandensis]|uniref:hypothetical protein n=1 Tax=Winogradskyella helgolandensis TaxID=2697010 RepID=UPI0015B97FC2|nr:hypothetical protein [Winogradskyella helgolandensis]